MKAQSSGRATGMGGHHSARALKDEWLTPPELLKKLGHFDLDPCAPIDRPWDTAEQHFTIEDDGLSQSWHGRVWCNPPYGLAAAKWLHRMAEHGNGVALIFARTETRMFFEHVWPKADALLFIKGRLYFHHVDGSRAAANSGAPSVLVAYGRNNAYALRKCGIPGQYIDLSKGSRDEWGEVPDAVFTGADPLAGPACPPAKAADEDDLDAQLQHFWGSCYWSNLLRNNPSLSDETKNHLLKKSEEIDRLRATVMQSSPATELAPESWREELETIAEILEADGDEWHCAARIRKMLKTSPAKAQVPEGYRAVPATPTPDMTMQGALAGVSHANGEFSQKGAEAVYKAMLAASPAPDHNGDGNEMVEVPFHKLALGTRFRYTSIPESEYVKISATQVARWQDDMAIAGWAGQGVYSFDEKDGTDTKVLVAVPTGLRQEEEAER